MQWSTGDYDRSAWTAAANEARTLFAEWIGVQPTEVSTMGSLAEAAATVAASVPAGRVVVPAEEFHSNLFPWMARHEVMAVPARGGATRVEDLMNAVDRHTVLLAVSEVTSREGQRLDLAALRAATDRVGARLFVNLTQSLGALYIDPTALRPDYVAVHGYKWMLCPRGAAWLVTRHDRISELKPLAPNWNSTQPPYSYFGGPMHLAATASRCDVSPAWLSWIGACAALQLLRSLNPVQVQSHCLRLAGRFAELAHDIGFLRAARGPLSHIVTLCTGHADALARALAQRRIRATALGDRVRFGFHYFNHEDDIEYTIDALRMHS